MSGYKLGLLIHLLGVLTLFGAIAIEMAVGPRVARAKNTDELRTLMGVMVVTERMFPVATVTIIATGLYLVDKGWSFSTPFVVGALVMVVYGSGVGNAIPGRHFKKLGERAAEAPSGPIPPDLAAAARAPFPVAAAWSSSAAALTILWLMVEKPGWAAVAIVPPLVVAVAFAAGMLVLGRAAAAPAAAAAEEAPAEAAV